MVVFKNHLKQLRDGGAKTMYMFLIGSLRPVQFDF